MSRAQIKRFGRRCRGCGIRKSSTITRMIEHHTLPAIGRRAERKRGTVKPQTLLCNECAAVPAA